MSILWENSLFHYFALMGENNTIRTVLKFIFEKS